MHVEHWLAGLACPHCSGQDKHFRRTRTTSSGAGGNLPQTGHSLPSSARYILIYSSVKRWNERERLALSPSSSLIQDSSGRNCIVLLNLVCGTRSNNVQSSKTTKKFPIFQIQIQNFTSTWRHLGKIENNTIYVLVTLKQFTRCR